MQLIPFYCCLVISSTYVWHVGKNVLLCTHRETNSLTFDLDVVNITRLGLANPNAFRSGRG